MKGHYADRPRDDEQRAALAAAARGAGVPAPVLLDLVARYLDERGRETGTPPTAKAAAENLGDAARLARKLMRKLGSLNSWTKAALPDGGEAVADLQPCLTAAEMMLDRAARDLDLQRRQRLDRAPGTARWNFAWALADAWAATGRTVAGSHGTPFLAFATEVFQAVGEPVLSERWTRELADKWRTAAHRTVAAREPALASETSGPAAVIIRSDDHGTVMAWTSPKRRFVG